MTNYIMEPYDNALAYILKCGNRRKNRTGIDTITVFGMQRRYNISHYYPVLTKRKTWPKSVIAELLWWMSGSTNNHDAVNLGCKYWSPWVDDKFTKEKRYPQGDFGPTYGFQVRNYGGDYNWITKRRSWIREGRITQDEFENLLQKNPARAGIDQLQKMVDRLKSNPDCRRNIIDLWNVVDILNMKLPPCAFTFQVLVHDKKITGVLTQRSCDFPIGVPANIQFYSTLIHLLAAQTGLKAHELVHNTNDSHIYVNQIDEVREYLARPSKPSPGLIIFKQPKLSDFKLEHFNVLCYNPGSSINFQVSV